MQNKSRKYFLLFVVFFLFFQCSQEFEIEGSLHPTVETYLPGGVTEQGAILKGEVLYTGSEAIIDHGFVYGDIPKPDIESAERISLGGMEKPGKFQGFANRNLVKDKEYIVRAYAKTKSYLVYGSETSFISKGSTLPELKGFFPAEGVVGDTVYLIGEGFSSALAKNVVTFNGVTATIASATTDTLTVAIPVEAKAGENKISLSIGVHSLGFEKIFKVKEFSFQDFSPKQLTFGDTLFINGENFSKNKTYIKVSLLGAEVDVVSLNSQLIKVVVPDTLDRANSRVSLTIGKVTKSSEDNLNLLPPKIHSVSPLLVTRNTLVEIEGAYFSPVEGQNKVSIGTTPLYILKHSKTRIEGVISTELPKGIYPLVIEVLGQRAQSTDSLGGKDPFITGITPEEGTWGDEVTIRGRNFGTERGSNKVLFDNVEATVLEASSERMVVKVPNELQKKASAISVQVSSNGNLTATSEEEFVLSDPLVSNFTPKEGGTGTLVIIYGKGFHPENNSVQFGQFTASVVSNSTEQLQVILPEGLINGVEVEISVSFGEVKGSSSETFRLLGPWRRVADIGGMTKAEAIAFSIENAGYVGLGSDNFLWSYNPLTDTWEEKTKNGFIQKLRGAAAFVIDGKGYAGVGSVDWSKTSKDLFSYDPVTDSWFVASVYPGDALTRAVGFSIAGKGYLTTGAGWNSKSRQLWLYNPVTNSWNRQADLPGAARAESTGFVIGNRGFIVGGEADAVILSDVWRYNSLEDTWQEMTPFPGEARSRAVAFSIGEKAYVLGGIDSQANLLNDAWEYDAANDAWRPIGSFPGLARINAVVFVVNGRAYIGSGQSAEGYQKDFWEFDPAKM